MACKVTSLEAQSDTNPWDSVHWFAVHVFARQGPAPHNENVLQVPTAWYAAKPGAMARRTGTVKEWITQLLGVSMELRKSAVNSVADQHRRIACSWLVHRSIHASIPTPNHDSLHPRQTAPSTLHPWKTPGFAPFLSSWWDSPVAILRVDLQGYLDLKIRWCQTHYDIVKSYKNVMEVVVRTSLAVRKSW